MYLAHLRLHCVITCLLASVSLAQTTITREGQPTGAILVSERVSESERWAAQELQTFLRQMSGAQLPVQAANEMSRAEPGHARILVGNKTARARHPRLTLDGLGEEGFVIKTLDHEVVIAGGEKRGTLYGVYTFLEKLGCRWWTPTANTIPKMHTITAPRLDLRQVPKLEYRDMLYLDMIGWKGTPWAVRNKLNGPHYKKAPAKFGGQIKHEGNIVHSYARLLARNETANYDKKQEMWALYKGKRNRSQPCLTNHGVIQALTESVLNRIRKHPEEAFVVVGQNDGHVYCQCDKCQALTDREGSAAALVLHAANCVADEVAKQFPQAYLMASAYHWSRKPPARMKPRDNVMIALSSIECDFGHPLASSEDEETVGFRQDIEGWRKIAKRLYIWDYTTNFGHFFMPFPDLDVLTPNIKFYVDHHASGYFAQGAHVTRGSELAPLRMWVLTKAMWDPEADNSALINEFLDGYYGPAADSVRAYIETIHRPVRADGKMRVSCQLSVKLDQPWLAPDVLAAAEVHLRAAEEKASGDSVIAKRVRAVHLPLWYVLAMRGPSSASWRAVDRAVGTLSGPSMASSLLSALKEGQVGTLAENRRGELKEWRQWLDGWSKRCGDSGDALPPEIRVAEPGSYRLIQASQIQRAVKWWGRNREQQKADTDASDGWVLVCRSHEWYIQCPLSPRDDFEPGKRYTLFVRVKGPRLQKGGPAFGCGIYSRDKGRINKTFAASDLSSDSFRALEVGTIELQPGHAFWFALRKQGAAPEVCFDCLWLQRAEEAKAN